MLRHEKKYNENNQMDGPIKLIFVVSVVEIFDYPEIGKAFTSDVRRGKGYYFLAMDSFLHLNSVQYVLFRIDRDSI